MPKANNKTVPTELSVLDYLEAIENPQRKEDCIRIHDMMKEITGKEPKMWGTSIVGFGTYHYKYESGREGNMLMTGFSNRKQSITLYILGGLKKRTEQLEKLGPHKTGKSCLYIKKLADIDINVLKKMIEEDFDHVHKKYEVIE
ncbi:MAG: DUF1801 domain-containing protein [Balneola sp.]